MPDDLRSIWEEDEWDDPAPAVSAERVREWEQEFGVRLPATLARMLMIRNGGVVRGTDGLLGIEPLERFEPLSLPEWDHLFRDDNDRDADTGEPIYRIGDPGQVLRIGNLDASHLLLDYNAGEEPRILWIAEDDIDLDEEPETFDELIRRVIDPGD
ncbi:SMI1/KNR4 family protein [Tundrisphaera sp. TA3]|uniref:SMI1/KNR4 family protein n=1 Tax=Tundrisphaera sp. TA3 TaxID=3435775 RepID=UPI003EBEA680